MGPTVTVYSLLHKNKACYANLSDAVSYFTSFKNFGIGFLKTFFDCINQLKNNIVVLTFTSIADFDKKRILWLPNDSSFC